MIRLVLLVLGFCGVTLALIVLQPGARPRPADDAIPPQTVTRDTPSLTDAIDLAGPQRVLLEAAPEPTRQAPVADPAPRPQIASTDATDPDMRQMTWSTVAQLNALTGRGAAPGHPGSLLHGIVQRSLTAVPAAPQVPRTYRVAAGETLVSIADQVYGDVNMTGPLFAANQTILARPDDLREGQILTLPQP
ncbi:LysM peptidoglycan-binding domain-containing protein [Thalassococcus sp. BH17M4-6]|uniref:LysM peptidoglycan-binding domain-containing protein n=1 Tax=Thalassococcus sp. BH17M4-6 TaxID=3413148 RepID=UPI003BE038DC